MIFKLTHLKKQTSSFPPSHSAINRILVLSHNSCLDGFIPLNNLIFTTLHEPRLSSIQKKEVDLRVRNINQIEPSAARSAPKHSHNWKWIWFYHCDGQKLHRRFLWLTLSLWRLQDPIQFFSLQLLLVLALHQLADRLHSLCHYFGFWINIEN